MTDWSAFFNAFMERIAYTAPVILICVVGMIVAVIKINQDRKPAILVVIAVTIMFIAEMIYTAIQSYWFTNGQLVVFGFPMISLGFAALVVSALSPLSLLGRLKIPGASFLATMSYSLYLLHKQIFLSVDCTH